MADSKDLNGDYFSPELCLKRELFEELHLDLKNKNHVLNYQMKYLKTRRAVKMLKLTDVTEMRLCMI